MTPYVCVTACHQVVDQCEDAVTRQGEGGAHKGRREQPGMVASVGEPMTREIFSSRSISSLPGNRGLPASSSANTHPTLHMSTSGP